MALFAAAHFIVLNSFAEEEQQELREDAQRAVRAQTDEIAGLASLTRDWSFWDDTYAFIADHNAAYIHSNLTLGTNLANTRLNLLVFVNAEGRIVYARNYDYRLALDRPVLPALAAALGSGSPLLALDPGNDGVTGLLALPDGIALVAAEPIMTSAGTGPRRGTLLFGRYLDRPRSPHWAHSLVWRSTCAVRMIPTSPPITGPSCPIWCSAARQRYACSTRSMWPRMPCCPA